jgi:histidine phosphotransferase ChpT
MSALKPAPLQLAALLCSRLCHDLISPVGAIGNGLEVLRDEDDAEMRAHALTLIEASAHQASARLQFARIAFGAAGSAGAEIELGDALALTQNILARGKISVDWKLENKLMPKDIVKLLLNVVLISIDCIPRGGVLIVQDEQTADTLYRIEARGTKARLGADVKEALFTPLPLETLDSRQIQPAFTRLIGEALELAIAANESEEVITFTLGRPAAAAA